MTHVMIDLAGRGHYDDCPICRAMAKPNATDEEVLAAFDECEGHRLEDVQRWFETITAVLEAEGARTDIENMDDDQLRAHFDRVSQINAELRSQMTN